MTSFILIYLVDEKLEKCIHVNFIEYFYGILKWEIMQDWFRKAKTYYLKATCCFFFVIFVYLTCVSLPRSDKLYNHITGNNTGRLTQHW